MAARRPSARSRRCSAASAIRRCSRPRSPTCGASASARGRPRRPASPAATSPACAGRRPPRLRASRRPERAEALRRLAGDVEPVIRATALAGFADGPIDEADRRTVLAALGDPDWRVQAAACQVLAARPEIELPAPAATALVALWAAEPPQLAVGACARRPGGRRSARMPRCSRSPAATSRGWRPRRSPPLPAAARRRPRSSPRSGSVTASSGDGAPRPRRRRCCRPRRRLRSSGGRPAIPSRRCASRGWRRSTAPPLRADPRRCGRCSAPTRTPRCARAPWSCCSPPARSGIRRRRSSCTAHGRAMPWLTPAARRWSRRSPCRPSRSVRRWSSSRLPTPIGRSARRSSTRRAASG